ncbi:putative ATP-binding cassette transporter [Thozetella sp. PMI_491]|nr:putative ATP-binding cassette transporter [Thozetella sp. PMI_491]
MCTAADDDSFGPIVGPNCRGGFDFTLLFEQSFLTFLPAVIFLAIAAVRFGTLTRAKVKTQSNPLRIAKLLASGAFIALQVVVLVFTTESVTTTASLIAAAANVAAAVQLFALSWIEDARSVQPSTTISAYLLGTIFLDIPQLRTLWILYSGKGLAACFAASTAAKLVMLALEDQSKTRYLAHQYRNLPLENTCGLINRCFLLWINPIILRGYRSSITMMDVPELDAALASAAMEPKLQHTWESRRRPERQLEFVWAVWRAFWRPMAIATIPRLVLIPIRFTRPFIISSVLTMLTEPEDQNTSIKAACLVLGTALVYIVQAVIGLLAEQLNYRCILGARGAIIGLIYDRSLKMQDGVYDHAAAVTLMSGDSDRIAQSLTLAQTLLSRFIEVALGLYLLARQLGWVCVVPITLVAMATYASSRISSQISGHQRQWMAAVQMRVGTTASALAEIRSIKMMGLSPLTAENLQNLRIEETNRFADFRWDVVLQNVTSNFPSMFIPAVTFGLYAVQAALQGNYSSIDTKQAFTSLSIMYLVTGPAAMLLFSITFTIAGMGSFDRIQKFLLSPARDDKRQHSDSAPATNSQEDIDSVAISAKDLTARPTPTADPVLHDINFSLPQGSFTTIIGPVASGKSTLLKMILGEGIQQEGSLRIAPGSVAYCAQTPWLPNTTIRKAISACDKDTVDEEWYKACLSACALDYDLSLLHDGDATKIGSGSTTLSGGQKHRVALARAVYSRAKIIVLDDVFSALDTKTRKSVLESLFGTDGVFKKLGSTVVLATHAAECLVYGDKIIVLSEGRIEFDGTYNEAVITGEIDRTMSLLEKDAKQPDVSGPPKPNSQDQAKASQLDDLARRTGDFAVYKYYLKSVGWSRALVFIFFALVQSGVSAFSQIWLKWWSDVDGGQLPLYLSVYLVLPVINILGLGFWLRSFLTQISPHSSNTLHQILVKTVMRAPLSYFSKTDTGRILNMFSQDMTLIESSLATGAAIFVVTFFRVIASLLLITSVSAYISITLPFLFIALYILQYVYLRTSRQLRYLDLESKSPLYSHFLESLSGVVTIRSFGWQKENRMENHKLVDVALRPDYLLYICQRWLLLVLSLLMSAQTVIVIVLALSLREWIDPGFLGVSLTAVLGFDDILSTLVTFWTEFETSLGSIARIRNLEKTVQPEGKPGEDNDPPEAWPDKGAIEFHSVTASHNPSAVALHDVSVTIQPGQKVGLCGRTGSGKSSLVGTLLRLLEIDRGSIVVDGVDLSTLHRDSIRERFVTLPQDPLILFGSVRQNVDPLGRISDDAIIEELDRVGLWNGVLEPRGGLTATVTEASLSKGQQQLFALARALLKMRDGKHRILLLDEPTSSVDAETDEMMHRVIRETCADYTVITIAHRIETIMGSDVVVVMEAGKVVEFASPQELMAANGRFTQLVNN